MLCSGWGRWRKAGATVLLVFAASLSGLSPGVAQARRPSVLIPIDTVSVTELTPQGRSMLTLIYQGGPFRHDKDGVVFGNRERILPASDRGYYREYTVRTPVIVAAEPGASFVVV